MPAFYMSNTMDKGKNFGIFKKYFAVHRIVTSNEIRLDLFYNEDDACFLEPDKYYLFNIGVFIYKNEWGGNALRLFLEDCEKEAEFTQLLRRARGQFCLVMYYKEKFYVITDKVGAIPIYCYRSGDTIEISNIFLPLAKNNNISLNYNWIAQYVSQGKQKGGTYSYFDRTLANEISVLDCGSAYTLGKNMHEAKYYDIRSGLEIGKYTDAQEVSDIAKKMLSDNLLFLKNANNVYCDITGGFDTRTNLAILMHNNIEFSCGNQIPIEYKDLSNKGRYSDLAISRKIADRFNLGFHNYTDAEFNLEREKWHEMAYDFFGEDNWTYARRAGYYAYLKDRYRILISGVYGGELLVQYYGPCGYTPEKFNMNAVLHRYFPYCDIMKDEYYSEEKYRESLRNVLEDFVSHTDFQRFDDAGTYFHYLTFYRTFFSKYVGAMNAIIPAYNPYQEADFIRLMAQTSFKLKSRYFIQRCIISELNPELGDIETSHGYPATKVTFKNFYKFTRLLYPLEPSLQYIGPFDRLMTSAAHLFRRIILSLSPSLHPFAVSAYGKITGQAKYIEEVFSTYPLMLDEAVLQIEEKFREMPVSRIIDKHKLKQRNKTYYLLMGKINNLNRLLNDIRIIE